ncbi:DUF4349 domain-containing protein [Bacillus andreraoultii]|uniref:DUF4349 domain-containing protein n=1 Tax=Bacillus andreraoultii TaxID=1499685 RepID=UPI00053A64D8|nr:DUF4349 domain-containing protein [Bacillus andreraoultii]
MKKWCFITLIISLLIITGCSNDKNGSQSSKSSDIRTTENLSGNFSAGETENEMKDAKDEGQKEKTDTVEKAVKSEETRKIIYNAYLHIQVKDYQKSLDRIIEYVEKYNGYVVDSMMSQNLDHANLYGEITVRVPQDKFREFLTLVEKGSSKVIDRSITGLDVTEEYVDLQSRLKSKRVVENRLLAFMEEATKTEDLLSISKDLATVQEEIETIVGRMNYLQNQADLATVTISLEEKNVKVGSIGNDQLNTWEMTKDQFKKSINFLIVTFSSMIVFLVGNLPVLILISLLILAMILIIKRRKGKNNRH